MKGSGKTVHLLQAMAMGFMKKWAVITIPEQTTHFNGVTSEDRSRPAEYRPALLGLEGLHCSPKKGKVVKKIVTGMKGSGKTVHLLQAMAMGFMKKWASRRRTVPGRRNIDQPCLGLKACTALN
jgi:hypothetical protein